MQTVLIGGVEFKAYSGFMVETYAFPEGTLTVYEHYPNFVHPITISQLIEMGYKFETFGDLFDVLDDFQEKAESSDNTNHRDMYLYFRRVFYDHLLDLTNCIATSRENWLASGYDLSARLWEIEDRSDNSMRVRTEGQRYLSPLVERNSMLEWDGCTTRSRGKPFTRVIPLYLTDRLELPDVPDWQQTSNSWSYVPNDLLFLSTPSEEALMKDDRNFSSMLFLGVELEVSTIFTVSELMAILTVVEPVQDPFFFVKEDASVAGRHNYCFELVTYPATPKYQRTQWRTFFKKIEELATMNNVQVDDMFDTSRGLNNGLHVHMSRSAFTNVSHQRKFLASWNLWDKTSQEFYQKIGKRDCLPAVSEYYHIHPDMDGRTLARRLSSTPAISRRHDSERRHSICHPTSETLELRIFQGIFNLDHVLASLEITLASFEYTRDLAISKLKRNYVQRFSDWVMKHKKYNLAKEAIQCA